MLPGSLLLALLICCVHLVLHLAVQLMQLDCACLSAAARLHLKLKAPSHGLL